jgi:hypothetical protein
MAHLIPMTKPPRRGTLYTKEELLVISKYKAEYKEQTTRALRANVMRTQILVDLFNLWDGQNRLPSNDVESMRRVKVSHENVKYTSDPKSCRNLLPGCGITGARMLLQCSPIPP